MPNVKQLTTQRVADFTCPPDKKQEFLWADNCPGFGVRVTKKGKKYVSSFEWQGTQRMPIGPVGRDGWTIERAKQRHEEIRRIAASGRDPRVVKAESIAADNAKRKEAAVTVLTGYELWPRYLLEGKPKRRDAWKPRYVSDLQKAAARGGEPKKRGKGKTRPGHLAPLLAMPLTAFAPGIGRDTMDDWFAVERKRGRGIQAKRAAAMFAPFLSWIDSCKEYRGIVDPTCARASKLKNAPANKPRTDALELAQLPPWFAALDTLPNRTAAVYLAVLLLIGARREELAALTWSNVDFRWHKLTINDKVEDTRTIPLTPYVASLLNSLPRTNEYVFASSSKSGRIAEPRSALETVLAAADIPHVSVHGLRRSFSLLGEQAGAPAGAIAQLMGHKPSAIAERYRPRNIDMLRPYSAQIEAFILKKANIEFDAAQPTHGPLRVVK